MKARVAIVAATGQPGGWGGSDELWSRAATRLVEDGVSVAACINVSFPLHDRVRDLMQSGLTLWLCPERYQLWKRLRRILSGRKTEWLIEVENFLYKVKPELVVLSTGGPLPPIDWVELCHTKKLPFVTIGHVNSQQWWFRDELATRYRLALPAALRCFFVSRANLKVAEKQIGGELLNAEVVRNPFNVNPNSSPLWPSLEDGEIRFACVGRLEPHAKGQDILLEALATSAWMNRRWRLSLYGTGPMKNVIERLVQRLQLGGRVTFAGHVSRVENIWAENHVLVMPSRYEGLPLAIVEAMLCARPVVATDVAGSEIVEDGVTGFLAGAPTVAGMSKALERLWEGRHGLRMMGEAAAKHIRNCVPADPAKVFSQKLQCLLKSRALSADPKSIRSSLGDAC
jgi:glycosyltransferase involved in cell wall biosynthesis